jgi:lysophospholipase L1-like esterase
MQIPYVDTHSLLIDPNTGYLKPEYQNDEYMHLTAAAYEVILGNLRSYAKKIGY